MIELLRDLAERAAPDRTDLVGLAVLLLGCLVLAAVVTAPAQHDRTAAPQQTAPDWADPDPVAAEAPAAPDAPVVVHVSGSVVAPGVVVLPAGSRVADAVQGAGGATADGVLTAVNLARLLVDGEQVHVPGQDEVASGGAVIGGAMAPTARTPDGRLELNRATAEDLEELPGIGEVTAGRVVAWREEHGPFADTTQLREVRGIGEATWQDLRDLVVVAP